MRFMTDDASWLDVHANRENSIASLAASHRDQPEIWPSTFGGERYEELSEPFARDAIVFCFNMSVRAGSPLFGPFSISPRHRDDGE